MGGIGGSEGKRKLKRKMFKLLCYSETKCVCKGSDASLSK